MCSIALTQQAQSENPLWLSARSSAVTKDLNAVYFTDAKRGWAAGDDGAIIKTEDGGVSWTQQKIATTDAINDIYFRNKEDGLLLSASRIWRTENGGATWRESTNFSSSDFGGVPELYSLFFVNKKRGWIVGSVSRGENVVDGLVLATDDGGATWRRQQTPTRTELIDVDFDDERRGWIVGANGKILFTNDGGATWKAQRSNTTAALYNVEFRNERVGWAVGEGGMILRTTDGGTSWLAVRAPVRSTLLSVRFVNENEGYIIGRGGVILRSEDGGNTWTRMNSGTKEHFYALTFNGKRGWAVGGKGVIAQYER